ncbi:MAG: hypothetical protein HC896_11005 [Bacteroidales bacterium]|nr:hypothetical protein [Bacteroidales bacterium]
MCLILVFSSCNDKICTLEGNISNAEGQFFSLCRITGNGHVAIDSGDSEQQGQASL